MSVASCWRRDSRHRSGDPTAPPPPMPVSVRRATHSTAAGCWWRTIVAEQTGPPAVRRCRSTATAYDRIVIERPGPWCGTAQDIGPALGAPVGSRLTGGADGESGCTLEGVLQRAAGSAAR